MYRKVAAAFVAALALALASCGGSEPQLTRAQLVRKIEVACRQGERVATRETRAGFAVAISASQHVVMERIDDLNPTAAAKADFEALKAAMQQRLRLIDRLKAAGRAEAQRVMREVQAAGEAATRRAQAAERALNLTGCL